MKRLALIVLVLFSLIVFVWVLAIFYLSRPAKTMRLDTSFYKGDTEAVVNGGLSAAAILRAPTFPSPLRNVVFSLVDTSGKLYPLTLEDKGEGPDFHPDDGLYVSWYEPKKLGDFYVRVDLEDEAGVKYHVEDPWSIIKIHPIHTSLENLRYQGGDLTELPVKLRNESNTSQSLAFYVTGLDQAQDVKLVDTETRFFRLAPYEERVEVVKFEENIVCPPPPLPGTGWEPPLNFARINIALRDRQDLVVTENYMYTANYDRCFN